MARAKWRQAMNLIESVRVVIDQYLQPGRMRTILLLPKGGAALEEWFPAAEVRRDMAALRDVAELQAIQIENLQAELWQAYSRARAFRALED